MVESDHGVFDVAHLVNSVIDDDSRTLFDKFRGEIVLFIGDIAITNPYQGTPGTVVIDSEAQGRAIDAVASISGRNGGNGLALVGQDPNIGLVL